MSDHVDPTREAFRAFAGRALEGPVHMLNLVRFRARAAYPDGREATGAEAYAEYARLSAPIFQREGGRIVWRGRPVFPLIGPADETWHAGFVAAYPTKEHFIRMVKDPAYQAIVHHRQAAVETSRLYAFAAGDGDGGVFG